MQHAGEKRTEPEPETRDMHWFLTIQQDDAKWDAFWAPELAHLRTTAPPHVYEAYGKVARRESLNDSAYATLVQRRP